MLVRRLSARHGGARGNSGRCVRRALVPAAHHSAMTRRREELGSSSVLYSRKDRPPTARPRLRPRRRCHRDGAGPRRRERNCDARPPLHRGSLTKYPSHIKFSLRSDCPVHVCLFLSSQTSNRAHVNGNKNRCVSGGVTLVDSGPKLALKLRQYIGW